MFFDYSFGSHLLTAFPLCCFFFESELLERSPDMLISMVRNETFQTFHLRLSSSAVPPIISSYAPKTHS